jgi:hypothetical protein
MVQTYFTIKNQGGPIMQVPLSIKLIDETPVNSFLSLLYYLSFVLISGGGGIPLALHVDA